MSAALRVVAAGPGVTLQDAGRRGYMRYGVTPAGPMDDAAFALSLRTASLITNAPANSEFPRKPLATKPLITTCGAALEVSVGGVELAAEEADIGLVFCGGDFDARLNGRALPPACALTLRPGMRLSLRAGVSGAWTYVAPFARFDLTLVLGSIATHTRAGLGGLEGRGLRAGDRLPLQDVHPGPAEPLAIEADWLASTSAPIRVLLGPQDDYFAPEAIELFLSAPWKISARSDRMAYRLEGPRLTHRKGHDIVSDGLAFGAIQIPGDGAPLVLMADRQPTGGYPKIAHVIGADLGALAQKRPGETVRFARVTWAEAAVARAQRAALLKRGATLSPLTRQELSSEFLLAQNLVDGAVTGRE